MNKSSLGETDLAAALDRVGIVLAQDELGDLVPGIAIMQKLIGRVNKPLPAEAEPAVTFNSDKQ